MGNVFRFRQAEEDLLRIADYIAADNPVAALHWLEKIERTFALLAKFPTIGEEVPHIRPGLRRFCQGSYLLFYEPRSDGICVVRILHGSQKVEDLLP